MPTPASSPARQVSPRRLRSPLVNTAAFASQSPTLSTSRGVTEELRGLSRQERVQRIDDVLASYGLSQLATPPKPHLAGAPGVESPRRKRQPASLNPTPLHGAVLAAPPLASAHSCAALAAQLNGLPSDTAAATRPAVAMDRRSAPTPMHTMRSAALHATVSGSQDPRSTTAAADSTRGVIHAGEAEGATVETRMEAAVQGAWSGTSPMALEAPSAAVYITDLTRAPPPDVVDLLPSRGVWEAGVGLSDALRAAGALTQGAGSVESLHVRAERSPVTVETHHSPVTHREDPAVCVPEMGSLSAERRHVLAEGRLSDVALYRRVEQLAYPPDQPQGPHGLHRYSYSPERAAEVALAARELPPPSLAGCGHHAGFDLEAPVREPSEVRDDILLSTETRTAGLLVSPTRQTEEAEAVAVAHSEAGRAREETERLLQSTTELMNELMRPLPCTAHPTPLATTEIMEIRKHMREHRAGSADDDGAEETCEDGDEGVDDGRVGVAAPQAGPSSAARSMSASSATPSLSSCTTGSRAASPPIEHCDSGVALPETPTPRTRAARAAPRTHSGGTAPYIDRESLNPTARRYLATLRSRPRRRRAAASPSPEATTHDTAGAKRDDDSSEVSSTSSPRPASAPSSSPRGTQGSRSPRLSARAKKHQEDSMHLDRIAARIALTRRKQSPHRQQSTSPDGAGLSPEFVRERQLVVDALDKDDFATRTDRTAGEIAAHAQETAARSATVGDSTTPRLNPVSLDADLSEDEEAQPLPEQPPGHADDWEVRVRNALARVKTIGETTGPLARTGSVVGSRGRVLTPASSFGQETACNKSIQTPVNGGQSFLVSQRSLGTLSHDIASALRDAADGATSVSHAKSLEVVQQTQTWLEAAEGLYAPKNQPSASQGVAALPHDPRAAAAAMASQSRRPPRPTTPSEPTVSPRRSASALGTLLAPPLQSTLSCSGDVDAKGFVESLSKIELLAKCDFDSITSKLESLKGKMEGARQAWSARPTLSRNADAWVGVDLPGGLWGPAYTHLAQDLHVALEPARGFA